MEPSGADAIEAAAIHAALQRQSVSRIDVRSPAEYQASHIPGTGSNPLLSLKLPAIPKDRPVVVYCGSSGRSGQAAAKLWAAGLRQVTVLKGGLAACRQAGFTTAGPST